MGDNIDKNLLDSLDAMKFAPNYHNWLLNEFNPYIGDNIVEVGAGIGSISKELVKREPNKLFCIEPSKLLFE